MVNGTTERSHFAKRPLDVSGCLQQYDALDVTDGVVTLVQQPAMIALAREAVTELLAVHDEV